MPLHVIIAAAKTVSRASVSVSEPPDAISATIRPTSMTVTATARTSDPSGSPDAVRHDLGVVDRCEDGAGEECGDQREHDVAGLRPHVAANAIRATAGTTSVHGR